MDTYLKTITIPGSTVLKAAYADIQQHQGAAYISLRRSATASEAAYVDLH